MFRAMVRLTIMVLFCLYFPLFQSSEVITEFDEVLRKGIFFNEEPKNLSQFSFSSLFRNTISLSSLISSNCSKTSMIVGICHQHHINLIFQPTSKPISHHLTSIGCLSNLKLKSIGREPVQSSSVMKRRRFSKQKYLEEEKSVEPISVR